MISDFSGSAIGSLLNIHICDVLVAVVVVVAYLGDSLVIEVVVRFSLNFS